MSEKNKLQSDPSVLAYQFHNPLKDKNGDLVIGANGKATVFGSPIYLSDTAVEGGVTLSDINQMVNDRKATCFLNGTVNVWKIREDNGEYTHARHIG